MYRMKPSIATFIVVLIVVACGGPTDVEPPASTGTTFTIPVDSEWQVPSGFSDEFRLVGFDLFSQ